MKKFNYIELYFGIFDFEDITHEYITNILRIKPTKLHYKDKPVNPKFSIKAKTNAWIFENNDIPNKACVFEEHMGGLLNVLEPKIDILSELSQKYYCEFSCAVFIQNRKMSTPWIHLDARYHNFARKVNVEIDFDIYNQSEAFLKKLV